MGQVPRLPLYLIIGDGRVSRHLAAYLSDRGALIWLWSRRQGFYSGSTHGPKFSEPPNLKDLAALADAVLLAIRDDAITDFAANELSDVKTSLVHFSGRLEIDGVFGFHPLCTLGWQILGRNEYPQIPFVTSESETLFRALFPRLTNPVYHIDADQKAQYHALCSLSGNLSQLLWIYARNMFEGSLSLPSDVLNLYMNKTVENVISKGANALTGPWVRGDHATIATHLSVLPAEAAKVYRAGLDLYNEFNKTQAAQLELKS